MNRTLKAISLLFVFLFHIGLGTACAMGLMRISTKDSSAEHQSVCHHTKSIQHDDHAADSDLQGYSLGQRTDCCKDIVYKFEKLDKQVKGSVEWSFTSKETLLIHYISFAYLQLFNPTISPLFVEDKIAWYPPPSADIRISISSFQI